MFKALGVGSVALVVSVLLVWRGTAAAQPATGNISGCVLWGSCVRIAIPLAPGAASGEAMPADGAQGQLPPEELTQEQLPPDVLPAPGIRRPTPQRALPAGAVLVAVQNTSISTRTDETGRFSLQGVPAGQYLTVAAGSVANSMSAIAERPNVFVNGGQEVQIGTLVLGGSSLGIVCRPFAPGTLESETGELP